MNTPEWILVIILSITLLTFLIIGIVFLIMLIGLVKETKKVVIEGQDIAKNANGVVSNIRGMTSIGGTVENFVNHFVVPRLKEKFMELLEPKKSKEKRRRETEEDEEI